MASNLQMVLYEGYLADDPVMRYTPTGKPVSNFRIGSNRKYKTADGTEVKEATWLKITVWGRLAEIVNQYCGKGSHVIVKGILKPGEKGSPEVYPLRDGSFGASYEITADEVHIIKGKDNVEGVDSPDATEKESLPFD